MGRGRNSPGKLCRELKDNKEKKVIVAGVGVGRAVCPSLKEYFITVTVRIIGER